MRVTHRTAYLYAEKVSRSYTYTHLYPLEDDYQSRLTCSIETDPPANYRQISRDYFGNTCEYFGLDQEHTRFRITVESEVQNHTPSADPLRSLAWQDACGLTGPADSGHAELTELPSAIRP